MKENNLPTKLAALQKLEAQLSSLPQTTATLRRRAKVLGSIQKILKRIKASNGALSGA